MMRFPSPVGRSGAALLLVVYSSLVFADQPSRLEGDIKLEAGGVNQMLTSWERQYLVHAVDRLFNSCKPDDSNGQVVIPREWPNALSVTMQDGRQRVMQLTDDDSKSDPVLNIYEVKDNKVRRLAFCNIPYLLPVASIIEGRMLAVANTRATSLDNQLPAVSTGDIQQHVQAPSQHSRSEGLTSYKPNRVGWTFDDNDVNFGYLDAVISVKYPLFHDGRYHSNSEGYNPNLYLAFTGRFSQYIGTIDSSPVVGKQFNPKLFSRWWLGNGSSYIDAGFAHESNGQSISTEESYQSEREKFAESDGDADFARNYISRGWDYLSLDWTQSWNFAPGELDTQVMLMYFLNDGPLQGHAEEYNEWENDGVNRRKQYDGISFLGKYNFSKDMCLTNLARFLELNWEIDICLQELAWQYSTGYDGFFDKSTNRAEFAIEFWNLPVMIWAQTGYNSDLVNYYKDVNSWGIALELESGLFLGR
jgi:hypothetical protein